MSLGLLHLAPALSAFLGAYPELDVELDLNDRIVNLIDEGYDLVLRIGMLETSSMMQRRLSDIRLFDRRLPRLFGTSRRATSPFRIRNPFLYQLQLCLGGRRLAFFCSGSLASGMH